MEAKRVLKTLVCTDTGSSYFVFVIPGPSELDLKKAAVAAGTKRIRLIPVNEITSITGYVRGGCSPIAMRSTFPTFIEGSSRMYDSIFVCAGIRGAQLLLSPVYLAKATSAVFADLV